MTMVRFLFVFFLLVSCGAFGQSAELKSLIESLQATFTKVETAAKTYEQEIKLVEYSTLNYSYKQTDQKGTVTSFSIDFNLADMDPYAVRQETQKDIIYVVLAARNKQKLIRTIKDGKTEPYDNELRVLAMNVDHARVILEIIKKCIPLGEKITNEKLKLSGYENMKLWLEGSIKQVNLGNKMVEQNIKEQKYPGSFKLVQIESDGKSSHQEESVFNVADINLSTLAFKISGNSFALKFDMLERLKSVSIRRDGVAKPFVDEVTIYTNGVDGARDIKTVLTLMAPLTLEKVKADYPVFKNDGQSLETIVSLVKNVGINDKTYTQSILGECITTFSLTEQTASSTEINSYTFNWMDVNPNMYRLQVSGDKMQMELPMLDKWKVVSHSKNDQLAGYDAEVNILVEDIEVGRRLRNSMDKVIQYCKNSYKPPFPADQTGMINWMETKVGEVTQDQITIKQTMELAEKGNSDKMKLTVVEVKASKSVEEVFEFNLSDVNPTSVDFLTRGKWIYVKLETNFKNKIIKAYKDGQIRPYVFSLEITATDIETARGLIAVFKKSAENLKNK